MPTQPPPRNQARHRTQESLEDRALESLRRGTTSKSHAPTPRTRRAAAVPYRRSRLPPPTRTTPSTDLAEQAPSWNGRRPKTPTGLTAIRTGLHVGTPEDTDGDPPAGGYGRSGPGAAVRPDRSRRGHLATSTRPGPRPGIGTHASRDSLVGLGLGHTTGGPATSAHSEPSPIARLDRSAHLGHRTAPTPYAEYFLRALRQPTTTGVGAPRPFAFTGVVCDSGAAVCYRRPLPAARILRRAVRLRGSDRRASRRGL